MKKLIFIVLLYCAAAAVFWYYRVPVTDWLQQDSARELPLLILAAIIISCVPVIPYPAVAGVFGAKFGLLPGLGWSTACSTVAAIVMYFAIRRFFQTEGRALLASTRWTEQFTRRVERYPFWAVFLARLIPVMPAQAVNSYAAVCRIPAVTFITATLLGKLPALIVYTLAGDRLGHLL
ncbi:TVP38/TMEM64 family protein [Paenibacillus sp. y28]|uniref:TVP38/TMEM64 family protein n=1 Tax=Paenibacillus sp. y28 TaxID=3129110 RepID=UPI0030165DAD